MLRIFKFAGAILFLIFGLVLLPKQKNNLWRK